MFFLDGCAHTIKRGVQLPRGCTRSPCLALNLVEQGYLLLPEDATSREEAGVRGPSALPERSMAPTGCSMESRWPWTWGESLWARRWNSFAECPS